MVQKENDNTEIKKKTYSNKNSSANTAVANASAPWAHPVIQNIHRFYLFPISKLKTKLQEHSKNRIILKIKSKSNKKKGEPYLGNCGKISTHKAFHLLDFCM